MSALSRLTSGVVMSIRGRGVETVTVQNYRVERDNAGRTMRVRDGDPIVMRNVDIQTVREWASSEEYRQHGLRLLAMARMFCRNFPGDTHSRIFWDGEEWEVTGSVQRFRRSRNTAHDMVTLTRVSEERR